MCVCLHACFFLFEIQPLNELWMLNSKFLFWCICLLGVLLLFFLQSAEYIQMLIFFVVILSIDWFLNHSNIQTDTHELIISTGPDHTTFSQWTHVYKFNHIGTKIKRLKEKKYAQTFYNCILSGFSSSQVTATTITATIMAIAKKSPRAITPKIASIALFFCRLFIQNRSKMCWALSLTAELNSN